MTPDPDKLLSDLTPCTTDAAVLVTAARRYARRRRQFRYAAAAAALVAMTVITLRFLPAPHNDPPAVTSVPPPSPMLTQHELLATFGDQPVALVTLPDGRRKLLSIKRPPARRLASR